MSKVLVVEDTIDLADAIGYYLTGADYTVDIANDGETAVEMVEDGDYDVMVLDLRLPGLPGLDVISRVRAMELPINIIVVSAYNDVDMKVEALNAGADMYMEKPFSVKELITRIKVMRRRAKADEDARTTAALGDMTLDEENSTLMLDGKSVKLSSTELAVLKVFTEEPGVPITRQQILRKAWSEDADVQLNIVEAYVSFLRSKFEFLGTNKVSIATIRNVGYRLDAEE